MFHLRESVLAVALTSAALIATPSTDVGAGGHPHVAAEVTSGRFETLAGGAALGYDVRGRAVMVRLGQRTAVFAHLRGLEPDTTYPAHVHNAPCSATPPGGSHYQHDANGPVDRVNEIWPTVTTNRRGNGLGRAVHGHRARPDAMSIVVHYPQDTSVRLACVDLT